MALQLAGLREACVRASVTGEELDGVQVNVDVGVTREDPHEMVLACRLLDMPHRSPESTDADADPGPDPTQDLPEETAEMQEVERKLKRLERRLHSSQLKSMRVFRTIVAKNASVVEPKILARDLVQASTSLPSKKSAAKRLPDGKTAPVAEDTTRSAEGQEPELILVISVYSSARGGVKTQTFEVLASQTLSEFRDRLTCVTDKVVAGLSRMGTMPKPELSMLDASPTASSDAPSTSAYFLIEGTFYSDLRAADSTDMSRCIREWIAAEPRRMSQFSIETETCRRMDETRWLEVPLRLGRPYSFLHCGRCDHHIVVEEIRLEHRYDRARSSLLMASTEPVPHTREIFRLRRRRRKCRICDVHRAAWITVNDRLAPENPCSFCDACYRGLHYDLQGRLVYSDFRVYRYYYEYH